MEDPACYLGKRFADDLPDDPEVEDVVEGLRRRGIPVFRFRSLPIAGACLSKRALAVLLPDDCDLGTAGHEAGHAILLDNIAHGIEYHGPEWWEYDRELFAERFREWLTGRP